MKEVLSWAIFSAAVFLELSVAYIWKTSGLSAAIARLIVGG